MQVPTTLRSIAAAAAAKAVEEERAAFLEWEMSEGPVLGPTLGAGSAQEVVKADNLGNEEQASAAATAGADELWQAFDEQNEYDSLEVFNF